MNNDKVYLIYKTEKNYDDEIGEDVEETRLWKIVDCESKAIKEVYELNKPYEFIENDDYKPYSYTEHKVESDTTTLKENILNDALRIQCLSNQKDKEIERLTAESTEWESKFYDEAKKVDKAIEYIETHQLNFKKGTTTFGSERLSMEERKLIDILKGVDKK